MKKTLLVIVVGLLLFSGISYAQDQPNTNTEAVKDVKAKPKKPTFWFGPKVGVDLFKPTTDQAEIQNQLKSNYQVGFFLQFGRKFYIQPEFYYATQKTSGITNSGATINTLKVPLMLGMRLINLRVVSAHIMGGPSASFLLKESIPNSYGKKANFAIQAGGGVDLLGFITLDVRYSADLSDFKDQVDQLGWDSGVNVTLGIKLR